MGIALNLIGFCFGVILERQQHRGGHHAHHQPPPPQQPPRNSQLFKQAARKPEVLALKTTKTKEKPQRKNPLRPQPDGFFVLMDYPSRRLLVEP